MGRHRIGFAAAVVVLVAVVAGCSSDDELSFEDWQDQVTVICDDYASRAEVLIEEQGEPTDEASAIASMESIVPLLTEGYDAVVAVEVPGERPSEVEQFYEDLVASEQAFADFVAALPDGDQEAIARLGSENEATNATLDESAEALGVSSCDSGGE